MKYGFCLVVGALALTSCTSTPIQPVPGSIIYDGQPHTRLTKSPIGSTFQHDFYDQFNDRYRETYQIQPDRSLKLVSRYKIGEAPF